MSGSPIERVRLRLSLRAKNLLTEEYPVTGVEVFQVKRPWFWEGDVNSLEGVGRFVLSLPMDITVEVGAKLKSWLAERGTFVEQKYSK